MKRTAERARWVPSQIRRISGSGTRHLDGERPPVGDGREGSGAGGFATGSCFRAASHPEAWQDSRRTQKCDATVATGSNGTWPTEIPG